MAITINGSGTVTGISAGGLPDNCITADDLATTLDLSGNTITLPSGTGGKVLQVVQNSYNTDTQNTTTSSADTGLSATITPSSTSSKILVNVSQLIGGGCGSSNNLAVYLSIWRGGTEVKEFTGSRSDNVSALFVSYNNSFIYLDSPSTNSATTYKTTFRLDTSGDGRYAKAQWANNWSFITLMEIAG